MKVISWNYFYDRNNNRLHVFEANGNKKRILKNNPIRSIKIIFFLAPVHNGLVRCWKNNYFLFSELFYSTFGWLVISTEANHELIINRGKLKTCKICMTCIENETQPWKVTLVYFFFLWRQHHRFLAKDVILSSIIHFVCMCV